MGNFQGNDRGRSFRGGNGGGRRDDRGPATMHKAICSKCSKNCEVPFRPSGDKPVYCNECFSSKRNDGDRGGRRDFNNYGPKRDFNEKPTNQFSFPKSVPDDMKKILGEINMKLDRLVSALSKPTEIKTEVVTKKTKIKPVKVVKKVSTKKKK